jgi:5,6-dimethylbenzimidazole synthase
MTFSDNHRTALMELLRWRRDVRHFRQDSIPEHLLGLLREAMELAPSVGNSRPWRVIRVVTPAVRAAVRAEFERCREEASRRYDDATRAEYDRLKLAGLDVAPEQLAVFTETDPVEGRGLGRQTLPATLEQSTAMAVHTLWLVARAHGLGLGMVSILDPEAIKTLLKAPPSWRFSCYLCLGFPAFEDDTPLLHRQGWQSNTARPWETR